MPAMADKSFDVCIRGAGIVGRALALLLARQNLRVALAQPPRQSPSDDVRAYALNAASRALLLSLRSWPDGNATPVARMEVQADQGGTLHFDAAEQGVEALAWIVDVPALEARLAEALRYQPQVEWVNAPVSAPLTVVCEGQASRTRAGFGVEFAAMRYAQHAIAARLACEHAHGQAARQWFLPDGGILALLPLGVHEVALVWSVPEEQAPPLLALPPAEFAQAVAQASQGALGTLELVSTRAAWPLQQALAQRWCGQSAPGSAWVLAGDAAHTVHPLAGQGLNLGLADAEALARALHAREPWRHLADLRPLRRYERERKAALLPLGLAMDGLQQLFARREPPLQMLRNWGFSGFERSGSLKHWVARRAMGTPQ
jgi:2-polyprenyl-6-methoxyphenol hydroxylase-like FAD-dependent oxidoreductase